MQTSLHLQLSISSLQRRKLLRGVTKELNQINAEKAPGHDFINGKILKELPSRAKIVILQLFNSILQTKKKQEARLNHGHCQSR